MATVFPAEPCMYCLGIVKSNKEPTYYNMFLCNFNFRGKKAPCKVYH